MRILLVEDDPATARLVERVLRAQHYAVDCAADGATADELFVVNPYDLVVLDWSIPPPDGPTLLRQWRATGAAVPVLMLTGHQSVDDRVAGLDTGADDYLTKPFATPELVARVRSLLRRVARPIAPHIVADLVLDPTSRTVTVAGTPVSLPPREFAILEYLVSRLDQVVSRTELSEHVWNESFDAFSNVVDVAIYRLRRQVDGQRTERLIHTVRGHGYRLSSTRCP